MLPVEVLVPGANSSTCKHCGIYTGPSLLEPYRSDNNIYIYKAAYNNMMNHVIIFLVYIVLTIPCDMIKNFILKKTFKVRKIYKERKLALFLEKVRYRQFKQIYFI